MPDTVARTARNHLSREIYLIGADDVPHRIAVFAFTEPVCGRREKTEAKLQGRTRSVLVVDYPDGVGSMTVYKVAPGNSEDLNADDLQAGTIAGILPRNTVGAGTGENRPTIDDAIAVYKLRCVYVSKHAATPTTYREWDLCHLQPAESVSPDDAGDKLDLSITVYGADSGELAL